MKKSIFALAISALALGNAVSAHAVYSFQGSDTLAGVMTDAINASGMNQEIVYLGGGSGKGESAIVHGDQGIAPMSREMKITAIEEGKKSGLTFTAHVIGLDGVGVFVNNANSVAGMDLPTIAKVFTCELTRWEQIPGSGLSGAINAFRRNDSSGTTDTFKALVGISKFGSCVTVLAETVDVAEKTAKDSNAIGYSGHAAKRDENRAIGIARAPGEAYVDLVVSTIRDFSYPLARKLFVYEIAGAKKPNEVEEKFLRNILDRSFLDPILQDNEFYTID